MPTVPTFAVRETDVSRYNGGTSGAPLKPLRDDSALRALSSLKGLSGAPEGPPLCRETSVSRTANVGTVGMNGLNQLFFSQLWSPVRIGEMRQLEGVQRNFIARIVGLSEVSSKTGLRG